MNKAKSNFLLILLRLTKKLYFIYSLVQNNFSGKFENYF